MKLVSSSILALFVIAASAFAQPRDTYHTTLFGKFNPGNSGGRFSSIWGYAANGREYALLGGFNGTHIVDITVLPLREVAFIPGTASGWREMKTFRNYAYVVNEGGGGLQIIDLTNLPASASLVIDDTRYFTTAHTISQNGNYIYVNGSNPEAGFNGGTIIFNVATNPRVPEKLGAWSDRYVHDATIRNDTMWASAVNNGQLDIVYVGDKNAPRFVGDIVYPGAGTHNADVTTNGKYVMTTDEIGSTGKTLKVWDVSNLNDIRKVADYTHNPNEIIHNVHIKGNLAVIAWYTGGTRIVDISDPTDPVEVGYYDTHPGSANSMIGNWGTYPYFASGKIISSDMNSGLYVFTFDGSRRGSISGVVRNAETDEPIPFAVITIPSLGRTVTADAAGRYTVSGASDTLQYNAAGVDHFPEIGSLILATSGAAMDIRLRPIPYDTIVVRAIDAATGAPLNAFSWRALTPIGGGATSGVEPGATKNFRVLINDAATRLRVGAWGYQPTTIDVTRWMGSVDVPLRRGYVDDVELPLGWALSAPGDDAVMGRWEQGVPIGTANRDVYVQPNTDHTPDFGDQAYITQVTGTNPDAVGSSDVDAGRTTLTSPVMDLSSHADPTIVTWLWYSRDRWPDPTATNDTMNVYLTNDGGATWHIIDQIFGTLNSWKEYRYRVEQFMTPTSAVQFRVDVADINAQSWVEAGLDDFSVIPLDPSSSVMHESVVVSGFSVRPNPFSTVASINVTLARAIADARLELVDVLGRTVATIYQGDAVAGEQSFAIDAANLAAGHYAWRLSARSIETVSGSITIVK